MKLRKFANNSKKFFNNLIAINEVRILGGLHNNAPKFKSAMLLLS
jgi:hypothetical protein